MFGKPYMISFSNPYVKEPYNLLEANRTESG